MRRYLLTEMLSECSGIHRSGALVSIIMPVYNTPPSALIRAVDSIMGQSHRQFELLIIDDGSDARYREALDEIAAKDSRIRVYQGGHFGVSHARNIGLGCALGDWIAFIDSDDEVDIDFLSEALAIAETCDADFVMGNVVPCFKGGGDLLESKDSSVFLADNPDEINAARMQMMGPYHYCGFDGPDYHGRGPVAKLYRKSVLGDLRFNESVHIAEDVLFNFEFFGRCRTVGIVERTWYRYYQNAFSSIHSPEVNALISSYDALLLSNGAPHWENAFHARCVFDIIYTGITAFIRNEPLRIARQQTLQLFKFGFSRGLFEAETFSQYDVTVLVRLVVMLCNCRFFNLAFALWALKVRLSSLLGRHELFEEEP